MALFEETLRWGEHSYFQWRITSINKQYVMYCRMFVRKSTTIFQNSWLYMVCEKTVRLWSTRYCMCSGSTHLEAIFQKSELVLYLYCLTFWQVLDVLVLFSYQKFLKCGERGLRRLFRIISNSRSILLINPPRVGVRKSGKWGGKSSSYIVVSWVLRAVEQRYPALYHCVSIKLYF